MTASRRQSYFCTDHNGEHLDTLATFVEAKLDLTTAQVASLDTLMDTFKTSATESFDAVCANLSADKSAAPAPERLSQFQTVLDASSAASAQIRPSFDGFYASLTDTQQQELDRLISQRRQHRHGGREE